MQSFLPFHPRAFSPPTFSTRSSFLRLAATIIIMAGQDNDVVTAYPNHAPDKQEQNLPGLGE